MRLAFCNVPLDTLLHSILYLPAYGALEEARMVLATQAVLAQGAAEQL